MSQEVEWTLQARDDLKRLDRKLQERIRAAVYRFADTGYGQVKQLRPPLGGVSLRVGRWRVLFDIDTPAHTIVINQIEPRGSAYDRD